MKHIIALIYLACFGCAMKKESVVVQDSLAIDTSFRVANAEPFQEAPSTTTIKNFFDYKTELLTEDEAEKVVHESLINLLNQYDTMRLHTVSMNYTVPGTEETPEGEITTSKEITVTLFYDNDTTLRAVQHQFDYTLVGVSGFWKQYYIYILKDGLEAYYEDHQETIEMPIANFKRAVASLCLSSCGLLLSGDVSTGQVSVSKELNENDFYEFYQKSESLEREVLDYLAFSELQLSGSEYVYHAEAALDEVSNYDVFYTVSKSYYDRFVKKR